MKSHKNWGTRNFMQFCFSNLHYFNIIVICKNATYQNDVKLVVRCFVSEIFCQFPIQEKYAVTSYKMTTNSTRNTILKHYNTGKIILSFVKIVININFGNYRLEYLTICENLVHVASLSQNTNTFIAHTNYPSSSPLAQFLLFFNFLYQLINTLPKYSKIA